MNFASLVRATAVAGILLLIATVHLHSTAFGQDSENAGARDEAQAFDPIPFRGRTDFEVSEPSKVPRQVARAAQREGCDVAGGMKQFPLRFVSEKKRRFVLVYCQWRQGFHLVFDLADARRPRLVEFPFLAQSAGFGTTPRPGIITWRQEAGVFEAETGTDTCPHSLLRHVYQLGTTEGWTAGAPTFVIVRVDVMEGVCGTRENPWSTVWEAPKWPESTVVR